MSDDKQFYAIIEGKTVGPLTPQELIDLGLRENHYVWKPGMEQWLPAIQIEELDTFFNTECVPPPPPEAAFMQYGQPDVATQAHEKENDKEVDLHSIKKDAHSANDSKRSDKAIKVGFWLLGISAVISIWMSFQGMFLLAHLFHDSILIPCVEWTALGSLTELSFLILICVTSKKSHYIIIGIWLAAIIFGVSYHVDYKYFGYFSYAVCIVSFFIVFAITIFSALYGFITYRKVKDKKILYITIGLFIAAIFPTARLFATYAESYCEHFTDRVIALTDYSNNISIFNKMGHEVEWFDGDRNSIFIDVYTSDYLVLGKSKAYLNDMGGNLKAKYDVERSDEFKDGFSVVDLKVWDKFGYSFHHVGGHCQGMEYIRIVDDTAQAPEEAVPADTPASSSSSNESSSYEKESERRSESDYHPYKPERHETQVPMQVWKQCMSCLGTGQCNYCYGQGVYNDYTGTHDCPCCINGRCGICAGQGGHYEVEYETRVDYY